MRNTWLIIKREYLERVRTRSFIVLTLLLPAIVGGAFILPMKIATMKSGGKTPHLVVVTSSREDPDIKTAYGLGANSYVVKPVDFDAFAEAVSSLGLYWLLVNQPPK